MICKTLILCAYMAAVSPFGGAGEKQKQPPDITQAVALVTVYDVALCDPGQPCLQGNGDGFFASMIPVSADHYGSMAACDPSLFGEYVNVLGMTLFCGDSFGTWNGQPVKTLYYDRDLGFWVVRFDVFYPVAADGLPPWNYATDPGWRVLE